jgi:LmbE family N-acetylglucosaminyl deacetylase
MRAMSPVERDASGLAVPSRVLAVGAHPDDVEFGCGATLAKWAAAGAHVELCVLTDGSKGTWDFDSDLDALAATRRHEQRAAARRLGVGEVHFLERIDGELPVDRATTETLCAVIRASRPAVLLGHDPWKRYRLHPDHHAGGRLVIDALVAARDPHFFPGAGAPHRPDALLLFEAEVVDHVEVVDDAAVAAKVAALLEHRSQWRSTMGINADGPDAASERAAFVERVRGEITAAGGEAFKLLDEL